MTVKVLLLFERLCVYVRLDQGRFQLNRWIRDKDKCLAITYSAMISIITLTCGVGRKLPMNF